MNKHHSLFSVGSSNADKYSEANKYIDDRKNVLQNEFEDTWRKCFVVLIPCLEASLEGVVAVPQGLTIRRSCIPVS